MPCLLLRSFSHDLLKFFRWPLDFKNQSVSTKFEGFSTYLKLMPFIIDMLYLAHLRQISGPLLRRTRRSISIVKTPKNDNVSKEAELKAQPEQTFSVFPRIQDVQLSDLVGNSGFGTSKYYVERSGTGNLPVYLDVKNGGSVITELRRIHGNIIKFRDELQAQLPYIPKKNWKCIIQSNKIIIKGNFVKEVKNVLNSTF